jgi:photosystem II Psb28-2 protein
METTIPTIEIFDGIAEELEDVSLRRNRSTGLRSVKMTFLSLKALQQGNSFIKRSFNSLQLVDSEGKMAVAPTSTKLFWGGEEHDELQRCEIVFEISQDEQWDRFIRFMNRYATVQGMTFGETAQTPETEVIEEQQTVL